MEERYIRNIPALTEEAFALLREKRVLIMGCGGIGGHLLDMLLRIGVGTLRVCDCDVFESSNLNRQLLSDTSRIGESKVTAAIRYGKLVNPEVTLEPRELRMTEDNVFDLVSQCDAVLDALDTIRDRKILAHACGQMGIPYVFGAVSGWIAQAAVSLPGDHLIEILYPEGTAIGKHSVLSFTPALCASIQTSLCVKLLTGQPVETGKLYHVDLRNQEFDSISLYK